MIESILDPSEYAPYYRPYLDLLDNSPLLDALTIGMDKTFSFLNNLSPEVWGYRYAPDKWTPKDILQHLSDTERVFSYRALNIARNKDSFLPGFDENLFANAAMANAKPIEKLMEEYKTVRNATISLFENLDSVQLKQIGTANSSPLSVRAAGFIVCGHEIHHINIIKERYLV